MLDTNLFETRLLTAAEFAAVIASQRAGRGWSQETLAELAGRQRANHPARRKGGAQHG